MRASLGDRLGYVPQRTFAGVLRAIDANRDLNMMACSARAL
jgi:hypothetical protein